MRSFDIILLDADDTLFDFEKAEAGALRRSLEEFRLPYSEETHRLYHRINQSLWAALERGETTQSALKTERFRLLFEALGVTADYTAFNQFYALALGDGHFTFAGAAELCKALCGAGCVLYLATNGIAATQRRRLEHADVRPYIRDIFISEELGFHKPDTRFFDALFARLGITDRSRSILLGDSLTSDMRGGHSAGIATCWLNLRHTPCAAPELCDYQIENLCEFLPIVRG